MHLFRCINFLAILRYIIKNRHFYQDTLQKKLITSPCIIKFNFSKLHEALLFLSKICVPNGIFDNSLKVQSCKLCNNKYMIASTQTGSTEIFAFMAVLVFKLLRRKVLFINRKDKRNC